jgi:Uma2 family endonuclease
MVEYVIRSGEPSWVRDGGAMGAGVALSGPGMEPVEDHYVRLHEAAWADYERLLALRGETSRPRIAYLEGALEIMSPSNPHEAIKSMLGRVVEAYCLARGIEFTASGQWTLKSESGQRGAEPDECWVFGGDSRDAARPHVAIEVVWTSGGLDKLDIYRGLGIAEVWYWRRGEIAMYALGAPDARSSQASRASQAEYVPEGYGVYRPVERSRFVPGLDPALLARFTAWPSPWPTTSALLRAFAEEIAAPDSR